MEKKYLPENVATIIGLILFWVPAAWVIVRQVWLYLRQGIWHPMSLLGALRVVIGDQGNPWLVYPEEWIGLHAVLNWIPLSLVFFVLGLGVLFSEDERIRQGEAARNRKKKDPRFMGD
jgi:hypothetical protein